MRFAVQTCYGVETMGFIDTRQLTSGQQIEADLCIIGAGAAGLAIASTFFGTSRKVALLESGGMSSEAEIQSLYSGRVVGQSHAELDACRLRFFGGTTNHWTAHVRPLEAIDFEARPWVPHSGWPIDESSLAPFDRSVREVLKLPEGAFSVAHWTSNRCKPMQFERDRVVTRVRHVLPEANRNFARIFQPAMERSANVDTFLNASVLRIVLNEARTQVLELEVGTLEGVRVRARARQYVLAAGGIENPRVLLLSGIGSHSDVSKQRVGGFFANHPAGWGGYLQPSRSKFNASFHKRFTGEASSVRPLLMLSPEVQRELEVLNCWLELDTTLKADGILKALREESLLEGESPGRAGKESVLRDRQIALLARDMDGREGDPSGPPRPVIAVRALAEVVPNPESRVRLGDELDAFGQRKVVLDWRLQPVDSESTVRSLRALAREAGANGMGRFRLLFPKEGFESIRTVGSHHHMGTTRMHDDPRHGVVDQNCRVHGISNLFVAGCSVFPTYGTANPTFTLLALAYRLAEHLRGAR
jgi:choline dehydrogenase-like flavoprotein